MRRALVNRQTTETSIALAITLDGKGRYRVRTGIRFLDHMLELVARHGAFDLEIDATGDLDVDQHHTVEDLGIAIGARANVHVKVMYGRSSHHQIEAVFKAFARALRVACARDRRLARMLPSTKGLL